MPSKRLIGRRRTKLALAVVGAALIAGGSARFTLASDPTIDAAACADLEVAYANFGQVLAPVDPAFNQALDALGRVDHDVLAQVFGSDVDAIEAWASSGQAPTPEFAADLGRAIEVCTGNTVRALEYSGQFIGDPDVPQVDGRSATSVDGVDVKIARFTRDTSDGPVDCVSAVVDSLSGGGCVPVPSKPEDVIEILAPAMCTNAYEPTDIYRDDPADLPDDCDVPSGVKAVWLKPLAAGERVSDELLNRTSGTKRAQISVPDNDGSVWIAIVE